MKIPEYIFCELPEGMKGVSAIFHTRHPFELGVVSQFRTEDDLAQFKVNAFMEYSQVPGYRIVISHRINFAGDRTNASKELLEGMADYFLTNKVQKNGSYYKRYKED